MWAALPAAYLLIALVLHAVVARRRPVGNRVRQYLVVGGLAGLGLVAHLAATPDLDWPARIAALAVYAFACELYIFLFTFVTSSVSVALLLSGAGAGLPATGDAPLAPATMVQRRLETMQASGLLRPSARGYALSPRAERLVRCYRALRRFFRHPDSA